MTNVIKLKAQLEAKEEMISILKDIIDVLKVQIEKQANPLMGVAPYRPHYDTFPYKIDTTSWPPSDVYKVTSTNKILDNVQYIGRADVCMNEYGPSVTSSNGKYVVSGSIGTSYLSNSADPYWKKTP